MALAIQQYTEANRQEWDDFVNRHPEGRVSYLIGYKDVIEMTYGYEPSYWLFRGSNGEIKAIFPSFVKKSWILGNKLVSQPFYDNGGLLGDSLTEEDNLVIKRKLGALLVQHKVPFLEVHGGTGLSAKSSELIFTEKALHQYAILRLSSSSDEVWEKKLERRARKDIRKAYRSELECYQETTEEAFIHGFYPLYLRSMKRLGTPPNPQSFFLNCLRYLRDYMRLFVVKYQGDIIHTLRGFTMGKRVHLIDMPSNERFWDKNPSDLACWEFIKWAADNGYEFVDFGPVRYGGQELWKKKWGVEYSGYSYFYLSSIGYTPKDVMMYSNMAKIISSIWRKTVPLPLTRVIGPWLRKHLGD